MHIFGILQKQLMVHQNCYFVQLNCATEPLHIQSVQSVTTGCCCSVDFCTSVKLHIGDTEEKISLEPPPTVNGWNFHSEWTLPSRGDHQLETKVRVHSHALKLWTVLICATKASRTLKVISILKKPPDKHTSASLHLQYHATLMSVDLSRLACIAKCLWYGKKNEFILIIIFMSVHIIHLPPYGLPPLLVHFSQWRPHFDSSYLDDKGDGLTLLCPL